MPEFRRTITGTARNEAGLQKELVLYCVRHDYGTRVLTRTGNLAAVMRTMGHRDVRTATHHQDPELELVRAALDHEERVGPIETRVRAAETSGNLRDRRPSPEEEYRVFELSARLSRFQMRLSPNLSRAFQLRDIEGLSIHETARILGIPCGTMKAQWAWARTTSCLINPAA